MTTEANGAVNSAEVIYEPGVDATWVLDTSSFADPWITHSWIVTGKTKCALSREGRPPETLAVGDERLKSHGIDRATAEQHLCFALGDYYAKK